MQRRVALYQRGHANHKMKLDKILAKHEASQKHHIALVDMVKAAFIARRQRKQLRNLQKSPSLAGRRPSWSCQSASRSQQLLQPPAPSKFERRVRACARPTNAPTPTWTPRQSRTSPSR